MDKNLQKSLALPAFLVVVALIVFGTFFIGKNATKRETAKAEDCSSTGQTHKVEIENDKFVPEHIDAKLCDELTIVNKDGKLRLAAFGVHNAHIYYNGVTEETLRQGQELTVTLNQTGTYIVHDHLQEEVQGEFTVKSL